MTTLGTRCLQFLLKYRCTLAASGRKEKQARAVARQTLRGRMRQCNCPNPISQRLQRPNRPNNVWGRQCRVWVKSYGLAMSTLLLLSPRKPTFTARGGMSQRCHRPAEQCAAAPLANDLAQLDVGFLHHLAPALHLVFDEGAEFFRRVRTR